MQRLSYATLETSGASFNSGYVFNPPRRQSPHADLESQPGNSQHIFTCEYTIGHSDIYC